LGNGTNTTSNTAVQTSGLSGVTALAGGLYHSLALKSDGTVWAWGYNGYGELGNATFTSNNTPVQVLGPGGVGFLTGVTAIAVGGLHSLALKSDGTVWAWGLNFQGQLGNGTVTNSNTPVQVLGPGGVGNLTGVTALAVGGGQNQHSLALKSDGTVWAWGYNGQGQLGNATNTTSNTPVQVLGPGGVGNLTGVTALAGGAYHSLALKSDGTVWAWGLNGLGQLGNGTFTDSNTPVQVLGLSGVTAIAGGVFHSLALKSDGTIWAWGYNFYGQLGNGTNTDSNTPVQVLGLSGATAIAGGNYHSLALKSDGTVRAWGSNGAGALGDGANTNSNTPVQVLGTGGVGFLSGVTALAAGFEQSLALKGAAPSAAFSLSGDWSNTTNPNGPWSYNQGSTPLPLVPVWTAGNSAFAGCNQPAWAPSNLGGNFLPALMNANSCTVSSLGTDPINGLANVMPGDIVTHTVDGFNGTPANGVANFLFTLPTGDDGRYEIRGSVWDAGLLFGTSRPQDWKLLINGVQAASGFLSGSVSRSQAETFDVFANLAAGDTVDLQLFQDPNSAAGFFVGTNMSITEVSAAVPPQTVLKITPPPSVRLDALENNQNAFFFAERVSSVLPSAITVDATLPGTYNSVGSLTPGAIPLGTVVDSFLLHADPFDPNNGVSYSGSLTFLNPILGVIAMSGGLDQTDAILGAPGTLYPVPGNEPARGFELGFPDMFVISPDGKTLTFSNVAGGADDQLRIVTAASPPQPVAPGTSTTFTSPNVINQTVTIPPDVNMNGAATMRVSFIQVAPAVFNASIADGTSGNTFSGGKPVPAGTTCTPIVGAGGNCIITENKCFDANGTAFALCPITATTTPIQLTSSYKTLSPQPNPALLIASDGQSNYAVITTGFDPADPTISGGTNRLNSDEVIANLPGSPPSDTVPPTTTAATSPVAPNGANGWFTTSPVSVILASTDDTLVKQIAYSATGAQSIAPTTVAGASTLFQIANQGVTTVSYQATDAAGNVEALKTLTVKIDTTPPNISITSPTNGATYTINQPVPASYACTDPESSPAPSCAGPVASGSNIDTASVGSKSFMVNSTDAAGLSSTQSVSYSVSYNVCILYDPTHAVASGATIPLKLYLCDASGKDVSNSGVIVHATKLIQVSTQASDVIVTAGNANPDNDFRFDSTLGPAGGYIFNLEANLVTGVYNLFFTAGNDPSTSHFLTFQVK